jgi:hypothetical protein
MPIRVYCPSCSVRLNAPDDFAGRKVRCPKCQTAVAIPAGEGQLAPAPARARATLPSDPDVLPERRRRFEEAEEEAPPRRPRPEEGDDTELEEAEPKEEKRKKPAKAKVSGGIAFEESDLNLNKFVVKGQTKLLSSKKTYEIVDPDSGEALATAVPKVGLLASLLGMVMGKDKMSLTIEVRQKSDNKLVFAVRRSGLIFKKVQVLDGRGKVLGTYKTKKLSMSGGFHVYEADGTHFAEIRGKMFKAEYKFLTPDGETEMGSVSRTSAGLAKSLLGESGGYGVEIAPDYADDPEAKMRILGAALAIDALFGKKGGGKGGDDADDDGGGGGDD